MQVKFKKLEEIVFMMVIKTAFKKGIFVWVASLPNVMRSVFRCFLTLAFYIFYCLRPTISHKSKAKT